MNETQLIEWKASWRDEYLQWLCGFANAQGGVLEVGRDDAGQVVGLGNAARLMEELPNKLRDLLGIVADIDLLPRRWPLVLADRLLIWNPGELPEGWSLDRLLGAASFAAV